MFAADRPRAEVPDLQHPAPQQDQQQEDPADQFEKILNSHLVRCSSGENPTLRLSCQSRDLPSPILAELLQSGDRAVVAHQTQYFSQRLAHVNVLVTDLRKKIGQFFGSKLHQILLGLVVRPAVTKAVHLNQRWAYRGAPAKVGAQRVRA